MQSKSVFEIFSNSTVTFGRSFWGLMTTYWFALTLVVLVSWGIGQYYELPWDIKNPFETIRLLPIMAPNAYTVLGILAYVVGYVFSVWQVLIVKNNLFDLKNSISMSFKESIPKTILITFCSLVIIMIAFPAIFLVKQLFPMGLHFIPFIILFLMPVISIFYLGLILGEGKLKDVIASSISIALTGYVKTLFAMIILGIAEVLIALLLFGMFFFLRIVTVFMSLSIILLIIAIPVMYVILQSFAVVYFVEIYYAIAVEYEYKLEHPKRKKKDDEEQKPKAPQKEEPKEEDFLKGMHLLGEEPQDPKTSKGKNKKASK